MNEQEVIAARVKEFKVSVSLLWMDAVTLTTRLNDQQREELLRGIRTIEDALAKGKRE